MDIKNGYPLPGTGIFDTHMLMGRVRVL